MSAKYPWKPCKPLGVSWVKNASDENQDRDLLARSALLLSNTMSFTTITAMAKSLAKQLSSLPTL